MLWTPGAGVLMGLSVKQTLGFCQAWRCLARAESIAQRKLLEQRAQEGMGELGLEAKPTGRDLLATASQWCLWLSRYPATLHQLTLSFP